MPHAKSTRPPGDYGTADQAVAWALNGASFDAYEFLRDWNQGRLEDWPEFLEWLDAQPPASTASRCVENAPQHLALDLRAAFENRRRAGRSGYAERTDALLKFAESRLQMRPDGLRKADGQLKQQLLDKLLGRHRHRHGVERRALSLTQSDSPLAPLIGAWRRARAHIRAALTALGAVGVALYLLVSCALDVSIGGPP